MDWKTLRRERLAKAASFKPAERREGAWRAALDRAGDWWYRFVSLAWWEKGLVIGTGVLLAVLTPMAAFALTGGDDSQTALIATSPTSAVIVDAGPLATPTLRPSSTPKAVPYTPTFTSTPVPFREDCDVLRAATGGSPEEQLWFVDNCEPAPEPTPAPTPGQDPAPYVPPLPVPQQPTDTPQPEPSISPSQAASRAATWVWSNPAYSELDVSAGSCIPQASGSGWRVGCTGTTSGCVGAACELTIWVCVTDTSTRQC